MSKIRRGQLEMGYDLLLDPMCCTLGAVMFILFSLSLMTQEYINDMQVSAKEEVKMNGDDSNSVEKSLENKIEAVRQSIETQHRIMDTLTGDDRDIIKNYMELVAEIEKLDYEFQRLKSSNVELRKQNEIILDSITEKISAINTHNAFVVKTRAGISKIQEAVNQLQEDVARKIKENTFDASLPRERLVDLSTFWIIFKNHKMYLVNGVSSNKAVTRSNSDHCSVYEYNDSTTFHTPKAKAGYHIISDCGSVPKEVKALVKVLSPKEYIFQCAVWEDSFKEFIQVKKYFIEKGFNYNWFPFEGDYLPLTSTATSGVTGQR